MEVLRSNGRLMDPTGSKNVRVLVDKETSRVITFNSVLENIIQMKEYFTSIFANDPIRLAGLLGSGCYNFSFCSFLLLSIPHTEEMQFNRAIKQLSFQAQINYYHEWAEVRLGDLYSMHFLRVWNGQQQE